MSGPTSEPATPLPDGVYDAIVVDAEAADGGIGLELTILAGEHKGAVVSVATGGVDADPFGLLGIPATLTVRNGTPSVALEP